ncbi:syntaxin-5 isoform X1 [Centruroides vittatus]|uniref:syntaxin-5 isoform X1 n=1 Tax=Centruroides vittatus TaxID=120091 RepID=UPI00350FC241
MFITRRRRTGSDSERESPGINYGSTSLDTSIISSDQKINNNFASNSQVEMTCRDRTGEFMSTVKSMQGRMQGNGYMPLTQGKRAKEMHEWSEFMRIAKQIGKDISNTFTKLEKLTILAKRKSLFDDKPLEIQELTYIIKQDISSLNKQIAHLQEIVKSRKYRNGKHMQSHSNSVVVSLQSKLASMSNDFKHVLEVRTENLKHQRNRREQFTQGAVSAALPQAAMSGHTGSVLIADERANGNDFTINMDLVSKPQQQMQLIDEQDAYIQSRTDTMQNIEATIVELGTIFQQLAHMVKEQEEMVTRIDHNVEDTHLNVEAAHTEILKYFQSVTSNRWLMIKIFAVLIVFFIIFVVFVA